MENVNWKDGCLKEWLESVMQVEGSNSAVLDSSRIRERRASSQYARGT